MKLNKTFITFFAFLFILSAVKLYSQTPLNENSIKFENVSTATLVGQDGLVQKTTDGGITWSPQVTVITNVLYSNDIFTYTDQMNNEYKYQFAVGENGVLIATFDNGATWQVLPTGVTENLKHIVTRSQYEMYVCGNNGTMLVSFDMGTTWQQMPVNSIEHLNRIALSGLDANIEDVKAVVAGNNGTILYTRDFGATWMTSTTGQTTHLNSVTFAGGQTVIAVGDAGIILKSIDGGVNWTPMVSGTVLNLYDVKYLTDEIKRDLIVTGEDGTILMSNDLGETWTAIESPALNDLYAVNFGSSTFGISTGSEGSKIYTTDGGLTWTTGITTNSADVAKDEPVKLSQNYPNPFNPSTIINYTVGANSSVNIKVYDMTGREVRTLVNSFQNAGTHSVNFIASNLASGIYFYVLKVNTGVNEITKTMRMILTK